MFLGRARDCRVDSGWGPDVQSIVSVLSVTGAQIEDEVVQVGRVRIEGPAVGHDGVCAVLFWIGE